MLCLHEPREMKVLHVIGSVAPRDGGPTTAIHGMTSALAARGVEVSVATTNANGPLEKLPVAVNAPLRVQGVEYRYFDRTLPGTWGLSRTLANWLRKNVASYDVVEVHGLFVFATLVGCRFAARVGVPFVVRPLGMLDRWSLQQHAWKKRPYLHLIERHHLREAAAIHATSESEADGVRALGFGDTVRVIPLGVELPAIRTARDRDQSVVEVLYLSRLHPKKNVSLLLRAVHAARSQGGKLRLTIAGSGPDGYRAKLEEEAALLSLGDSVRFTGHADGDAKRALFAGADIFALPSSQENFGIAVAEALAVGLPVIISDQVAIASEVRRARAGLVVPVDVGAMAHGLLTLANDSSLRREMGQRGTTLAAESFSWPRTAELLHELYADLAGLPILRERPTVVATANRKAAR